MVIYAVLDDSRLLKILYSLDSKPPPESKPPVYNAFLMEKAFDKTPILYSIIRLQGTGVINSCAIRQSLISSP